jgi:hypothetical protein
LIAGDDQGWQCDFGYLIGHAPAYNCPQRGQVSFGVILCPTAANILFSFPG